MPQLPFQTDDPAEQRGKDQARQRRGQYHAQFMAQQDDDWVNGIHESSGFYHWQLAIFLALPYRVNAIDSGRFAWRR